MERIQTAICETFRDANWQKYHTLPNLCLALVSEVGELVHPIRWGPDWPDYDEGPLADEIADTLILTLQIASVLGLDAESLVIEKLETIRRRHGIPKVP